MTSTFIFWGSPDGEIINLIMCIEGLFFIFYKKAVFIVPYTSSYYTHAFCPAGAAKLKQLEAYAAAPLASLLSLNMLSKKMTRPPVPFPKSGLSKVASCKSK